MTPEADHDPPGGETPSGARRVFHRLANALAAIGTVWIFFLMFLVVADVLGRNFFNRPITGVAEFAARSVAGIVFLHLAAAISAGKMTRSDFLARLIAARSPNTLRALEVVFALIGAALFVLLAAISWPEWRNAWAASEYFGVQGVYMIPTWPFRALMVIGAVMAALAYLVAIPDLLRRPVAPEGVAL